jgi:uncharacterized membrane protein
MDMEKRTDSLKKYFTAGILAVVPLAISIFLINFMCRKVDQVLAAIPGRFNPFSQLPFVVPGLGVALVLGIILLVGLLVENYLGRKVVELGERTVYRIPVVRPVYSAVKQLLSAVFAQSHQDFKRVVLLEYPRPGSLGIGFVTGAAGPEIDEALGKKALRVFVPTTPYPTTGFFHIIPEDQLTPLEMSVEEAFKLIISGGLASTSNVVSVNGELPEAAKEPRPAAALYAAQRSGDAE